MADRGLDVLEKYDFEVKNIRKGRGALILETDRGLYTLREFAGSAKKLMFQKELMEYIRAAGMKCDFIEENREGELVSADKDEIRYVVRAWYEARECKIRDEAEVCAAAEHLARLHRICRDIRFSGEVESGRYRQDIREVMLRHNREMKKTRNYMRERRGKTDFEIFFLKHFQEFYEKGLAAREQLSESGYQQLSEAAARRNAVCHGSYNHHNVVWKGGKMITLDFDRCYIDDQTGDLYDFLRKVLEKWDWDIRLGRKILERYSRVDALSDARLNYLKLRLAYPEKFWKIANHYYNSRKSWIPDKNIEKLQILIGQEEKKEEFLRGL